MQQSEAKEAGQTENENFLKKKDFQPVPWENVFYAQKLPQLLQPHLLCNLWRFYEQRPNKRYFAKSRRNKH